MPFRAVVLGIGMLGLAANAAALSPDDMDQLRDKALTILANNSLDTAIAKLEKSQTGLLNMDGPGLHTWAFKASGEVIWDHSGQTTPGMNISSLTAPDGEALVDKVKTEVRNDDGRMIWEGVVPHPVTGEMKPAHLACASFAAKKYMCVMAWP
jgi:hypothetical protein